MQSYEPLPSGKLRHKTLSAYYPHLHSLLDYLTVSTGEEGILIDKDVTDYLKLLQSTICATEDSLSSSTFPAEGEIYGSQQEAIDRILQELGRVSGKHGEGRNALLAGDKVVRFIGSRKG